jgi:hypothetical protein
MLLSQIVFLISQIAEERPAKIGTRLNQIKI